MGGSIRRTLSVAVFVAVVGIVVWALVALSGIVPRPPVWFSIAFLVGAIVLTAINYTPGAIRRALPLYYSERRPQRGDVTKDGFEWHPQNEPTTVVNANAVRHLWWDDLRHVVQQVSFEVSDSDSKIVERAMKDGLRAATRALPGRGKVRIRSWEREVPGPTSRLRVRLEIDGVGADASWGRTTMEAFSQGLARRYEKEGLRARRLGAPAA